MHKTDRQSQEKTYIICGYNSSNDFGKEEVTTTLRGAKQLATRRYGGGGLDVEVVISEKIENYPQDIETPVCCRRWGMVYPGPTPAWESLGGWF